MGKIVVFDSGFGSLSIIKAIQKITRADVVYFADQKNFPYGNKSITELNKIIINTITNLRKKFKPDLIVVASNTPTLLLQQLFEADDTLIGVLPPLSDAKKITKTKSIAILATKSVTKSVALGNYVKQNIPSDIKVIKIDSSELIDLVESAKFIYDKNFCTQKIKSILMKKIKSQKIDVVTLSSTHLPFLLPLLTKSFPHVTFLDPANDVATKIKNHQMFLPSTKNSLKIFSSGNSKQFQKYLRSIGITNVVRDFTI